MTKSARSADLVEEDTDGEATRLADVYVYAFDGLLLAVDADRVSATHRAELVASAARDTDSIHFGSQASVEIAGNGYQVQLPRCRSAGFTEGSTAPVTSRQGALIIHTRGNARLAQDLATIRESQIST